MTAVGFEYADELIEIGNVAVRVFRTDGLLQSGSGYRSMWAVIESPYEFLYPQVVGRLTRTEDGAWYADRYPNNRFVSYDAGPYATRETAALAAGWHIEVDAEYVAARIKVTGKPVRLLGSDGTLADVERVEFGVREPGRPRPSRLQARLVEPIRWHEPAGRSVEPVGARFGADRVDGDAGRVWLSFDRRARLILAPLQKWTMIVTGLDESQRSSNTVLMYPARECAARYALKMTDRPHVTAVMVYDQDRRARIQWQRNRADVWNLYGSESERQESDDLLAALKAARAAVK